MSKLTLEQFKTEKKEENGSRLSLDQFKAKSSNNLNNEELEKLTGGILGACHPGLIDRIIQYAEKLANPFG
ncbi:hypothetical protein CQ046_08475 [Chryseobacterium sp. MYb7]|uniref:hypothetical protein n=1 Tax=Chryseobacterium sp. MYb7 TaxID=1827290 RepID=UPI000CFF1124|nr:hypothetical protein [Chryseobacterium sp. MYb7]PRB03817.1 hypothetical protein CQ046_08475 [Chryseobacterium sp. MYb7]